MKIRQIEIKDFGAIKNKTLKFTSGLNVLYDENGQVREAVRYSGLKAGEEITV